MSPKFAMIGLTGALLAACAPVAPPPATPAPPPAPAAVPAPEAVAASTAPIDVRSFSCASLLAASDDDRGYASMFFLGYRAALAHTRTIEIAKIEAIEETALTTCAASPTMPAGQAFAQALAANTK
jgi:hypothetical protein